MTEVVEVTLKDALIKELENKNWWKANELKNIQAKRKKKNKLHQVKL